MVMVLFRTTIKTLLAVTLLAFILSGATITASAGEPPSINVSDSTGKVGELIDVSISLTNNPGITTMRLNVAYDEEVLRLVKTVDKGVLGKAVHYPGPDFHSPYILFWVNGTSRTNYTVSGDIAALQFEILKEAVNSPVTVTYDLNRYDILNAADQKVDLSINNGTVSTIQETIKETGKETGRETAKETGKEGNSNSNESGYPGTGGAKNPGTNSETSGNHSRSSGNEASAYSGSSGYEINAGPGFSGAEEGPGFSGAEESAHVSEIVNTPGATEESGGGILNMLDGGDVPLAFGEIQKTTLLWVGILIAVGINAIGIIVIKSMNRRRKNN